MDDIKRDDLINDIVKGKLADLKYKIKLKVLMRNKWYLIDNNTYINSKYKGIRLIKENSTWRIYHFRSEKSLSVRGMSINNLLYVIKPLEKCNWDRHYSFIKDSWKHQRALKKMSKRFDRVNANKIYSNDIL